MMSSADKLRIGVVGVGSFGRNHARVYSEMQKRGEPVELAAVCDSDPERAAELAIEFRAQAYTSIEQMLAKSGIHAASVCVPTVHHAEVATKLLNACVHVLIEKPVTKTLAESDALHALATEKKCVAMVGHLERFNPAVRAVQKLITTPMFFEVHRLSIFTPRALDVDVVLDLMIHDLDIVLSLLGTAATAVRAVGLPILSKKVDIANARVEFASGCVANFTASRVSTERVRKMRFFQPRQYLSVDYAKQDVFAISVSPMAAATNNLAGTMASMEAAISAGMPAPGLTMQRPEVEREEPLMAELREFVHAVREGRPPMITVEDGRKALSLALDVTHAIEQHTQRAGLESLAR